MPDLGARRLRQSDWLVQCVVCEEPTHGFAVAGLFAHGGSPGRISATMQFLDDLTRQAEQASTVGPSSQPGHVSFRPPAPVRPELS
jgi:hypothetical protein